MSDSPPPAPLEVVDEAPAWLDGLNPPQKEAVLTTEGPVLMLAGAGTGKTAALTARLAHLIRIRRAWPSEILCVTFTNKAAREMHARVGELIGDLRDAGHDIKVADLGGGLGVPYDPSQPPPPTPADYGAMVRRIAGRWDARLVFEPGRLIVGNAGVLLSRVIRVKPGAVHPFVIVDAAMNDLMRPALYDAWHKIDAARPTGECRVANVVGPVCETGDTFATAREMDCVEEGDLVVFRTAGAYAAAMSSTYNSRPLTPEVLVDGERWAVVRPRVEVDRLIAADRIPDWLGGCAQPSSS